MIGQFAGTHGVRGAFRVRSFTAEPADIAAYGPVTAEDGGTLTLSLIRKLKPSLFLANAPEIREPQDAEVFKGSLLTVPRSALPPPEDNDEFYVDDLVGLEVILADGTPYGRVRQIADFGAGELLEIGDIEEGRKGTRFIPFTKASVPTIDLGTGTLTVITADDQ